jgi:hypothetical protein
MRASGDSSTDVVPSDHAFLNESLTTSSSSSFSWSFGQRRTQDVLAQGEPALLDIAAIEAARHS